MFKLYSLILWTSKFPIVSNHAPTGAASGCLGIETIPTITCVTAMLESSGPEEGLECLLSLFHSGNVHVKFGDSA